MTEYKAIQKSISAEFSRLINNLVDDCKEQGIETLPPDEIAHLVSLMGEKR